VTAVERIEHGDTVRTRDHGLAPMAQLVNPGRWSGRALCRLAYHRFDAAAFAAGGKACKPRILGIGADSGHDEHRSPNTSVATDARG
jgi:hypothetical protein